MSAGTPGHAQHLRPHVHDDERLDPAGDDAAAEAIWQVDHVRLTTVGIDIGSATSHCVFSRLLLEREAQALSSRFVVVERVALHRSPIFLTAYRADGLIDVESLRAFFHQAYADAGLARSDVDAGAVILTGVALERANARAIAELFADEGGRFVCASAGHNLEALLAAHGSGAVGLSSGGRTVLNIDVGGGTAKLALARDGRVLGTLAIVGGSRLVELAADGTLRRIERGAADLARSLGIPLGLGRPLAAEARRRLADGFAARIIAAANGRVAPENVLAGRLPAARPDAVVLSGGVGELVASGADASFGDLGQELAAALRARVAELPAPLAAATERIRATVIGASQFTVQVSGSTVHVTDPRDLPLRNVPVVRADIPSETPDATLLRAEIEEGVRRLDLAERSEPLALAIRWSGEPCYANLRAIAQGIAGAHRAAARSGAPIVVACVADIGAALGAILVEELALECGAVVVDGIELSELDYLDIGEPIRPANVLPVVVKSLVFPSAGPAARPQILDTSRRGASVRHFSSLT